MAHGKKKESALTPEEKLAQALIPDWEQPYKVPENWCWTTLGTINQYVGGSVDPLKEPDSWFELYSVPSSADNYPEIVQGSEIGSTKQVVQKDDVLLCKINPRINRVWRVRQYTENKLLGSSEWIVVRNCWINSHYLTWCFQSQYFREYMLSNVSGVGGSLMRAQPKFVQGYPIPIAPLAEQQRIVDRIEDLFAKLDEAKEKAQSVLDNFEIRKAAILHKAFTGELTAKWRAERGVELDGWKQGCLSDFCEVNPKKVVTKDLSDDLDVTFVPMPALSDILGEITDPQIRKLKEVRTGFTNFAEGDVVFAKITPCMENGKSAVVGSLVNEIGFGTTEFYVLRCTNLLYNRYLYHLVRSRSFRAEAKAVMTGAVGQQRVPKSFLEDYPLTIPSVPEQIEIVRILDSLFTKEQQAKEAAEAVLEKIDLLKKSILARAFRGELGTNDPTEENALGLLKKVLDIPTEPKVPVKRTFIPKDLENQIKTELERKIIKLYIQGDTDVIPISQMMSVSSKKFEIMDTLRSLQQRGILAKENDAYKLLR